MDTALRVRGWEDGGSRSRGQGWLAGADAGGSDRVGGRGHGDACEEDRGEEDPEEEHDGFWVLFERREVKDQV